MSTSAIKEKFVAINAGLTHLHWMASILEDINTDGYGGEGYQPSLASMNRSIELLFCGINEDYYALHALLRASGSFRATSDLMLVGEIRVLDLEEMVTALGVLIAHSSREEFTIHKCMSAGISGIFNCVKALRKHMSAMAKAWKATQGQAADSPTTSDLTSVPKSNPQRARAKAAEAVTA